MPGEACGYIIELGDQYRVTTDTIEGGEEYLSNVSCSMKFRTKSNHAFFIRISKFNLETSNKCANDVLMLYDGPDEKSDPMTVNDYGLCGQTLGLPNYFQTSSKDFTLNFRTDGANQYLGFELYITPFTTNTSCEDGLKCDKICVTKDAKCNGYHQCKDGSDEPEGCRLDGSNLRAAAQVIIFCLISMHLLR